MKKTAVLTVIFGLLLWTSLISPLKVSAEENECADGSWNFVITPENEAVITDYTGNGGDITVPAKVKIDGVSYAVTVIGDDSIRGDKITSVIIPNSVKSIGNKAFLGCSNLKSVILHDGVSKIGASAFKGCESLIEIIIPKSVIKIGFGAFGECKNLKSITFLNSNIEFDTFMDWGLYYSVFEDCDYDLLTIYADSPSNAENHALTFGIEFIPLEKRKDSVPFNGNISFRVLNGHEAEVTYFSYEFNPAANNNDIIIPKYVYQGDKRYRIIGIADGAFKETGVERVTVMAHLEYIGKYAFAYCYYLKEVRVPNGVGHIKEHAFYQCRKNVIKRDKLKQD
jgi:hypothetical protein